MHAKEDAPEARLTVPESGEATRFRAEPGSLYVVATPLGNLADITLRALDILGSVDLIAAEDTRVTAVLLRRYGIAVPLLSLHEHNEAQRAARIVAELGNGRSIALVSDAGTPAVSDPGARLVRAVRDAGRPVVPIPGANAAIAAISAAGLVAERFVFIGFLPTAAKARRELLASVASLACALVFYEAPHRVRATVAALAETLPGERQIVIAREVSKKFESIERLSLAGAADWLAEHSDRTRGEFVLLVDSASEDGASGTATEITPETERWLAALVAELPPARAARVVAAMTGVPRDVLYARALALGGRG